jgi:hypothetical protein
MSWRPGEPIVCTGCGTAYQMNVAGRLAHPAPWCETRREQARAAGGTDVLAAQVRAGVTYASQRPSGYRMRHRSRGSK